MPKKIKNNKPISIEAKKPKKPKKPKDDNFGKAVKNKMDSVMKKKPKKPKWMAWFEIRPGYHRGIGVAKKKDVKDILSPEELEHVHFTKYKNPKRKGDQKL